MKRFAVIEDKIVVNIIVADEKYVPPDGLHIVPIDGDMQIGDKYNGKKTKRSTKKPEQSELIQYAEKRGKDYIRSGTTIDDININSLNYLDLILAIQKVQLDSNASVIWLSSSGIITLTSKQVIKLFNSYVEYTETIKSIIGEIIKNIHDGKVVSYEQIDSMKWPKEFSYFRG